MLVLIKFTKPLQLVDDRGWRPGNIGGIFPFDVIDHIDNIGGETTLALKPPTRLKFGDEVVTLLWESPEKTIIVSIHTSLIADLTMQWR